MKKFLALILAFILLLSFTACSSSKVEIAADTADEFLNEFFSSYNSMNKYLKNPEIAISAFSIDSVGLSALLRAVYQSQSVTFAFPEATKVTDNVYTVSVIVTAPDIEPLYEMYSIDKMLNEGKKIDEDFVAQSFYTNIMSGTTSLITNTVTVILRQEEGKWTIDPSNDLAFAIFPNIANAN